MKAKIVDTMFVTVDLEPGVYHWCSCGESKTQPFCDGQHKGTSFQPRKLEVKEAGRFKMCLCKCTKAADGKCDGSHASI